MIFVKTSPRDQPAAAAAATSVAAAAAAGNVDKKLKLKIPKKNGDKIDFEFDPLASAIQGQTMVTLELSEMTDSDAEGDCFIAGYCVSETNRNIIEAVTYEDRINSPNPTPVVHDAAGNHTRFSATTKVVTFKVNPDPRQLIFIGLIVAIRHRGDTDHKDYLFDPQLGNGPPQGFVGGRNTLYGSLIALD